MQTRRLLGSVAVSCLLVAIGSFVMAGKSVGHHHLVPFLAPVTPVDTSTIRTSGPVRTSRATPISPPVRLAVPAVGLSAQVVPVGLTSAGRLAMPDPSVAGWYRLGPAPGAQGPSVVVGHVDSDHGPAVFYRLSGVRTGETMWVVHADGSRSRFIVSKVTVVSKADFPSRAVFGPTKRAALRLITCTGPFSADTGYADSLIVWGHATSS